MVLSLSGSLHRCTLLLSARKILQRENAPVDYLLPAELEEGTNAAAVLMARLLARLGILPSFVRSDQELLPGA